MRGGKEEIMLRGSLVTERGDVGVSMKRAILAFFLYKLLMTSMTA